MGGSWEIRPFDDADATGVAQLCAGIGWPSLTDPAVVVRVCTAPGSCAYVAEQDGAVVGFAQALTDGVLQSHLSFIAVDPAHRRRGIGRLLLVATFQATSTKRMDLITDVAGTPFYASFDHKRLPGFRVYPGA